MHCIDLVSDLRERFPIGAYVTDMDNREGRVSDHVVYFGDHIPYRVVRIEFHDGIWDYREDALLNLSVSVESVPVEARYSQNRVRLPSNFVLDVLSASCIGCVEIEGVRNIIWEYAGSKYLQECLEDCSVFYTVH